VPQPFAYEYGVKDEYTGAAYQKTETQNDYGVVQGSYKVGGQFCEGGQFSEGGQFQGGRAIQ